MDATAGRRRARARARRSNCLSSPFPSDLVPPGTHIAAELSWDDELGSHHTQLRILGDDVRGYLLIGAFELEGNEDREFWFATLDEAQDAASELGVPHEAWSAVTDVAEVGVVNDRG